MNQVHLYVKNGACFKNDILNLDNSPDTTATSTLFSNNPGAIVGVVLLVILVLAVVIGVVLVVVAVIRRQHHSHGVDAEYVSIECM